MDPNLLAAIIGSASGLVGAVIGGVIGARATYKATARANAHALQLQETTQKATVHGVLLGIRAEIVTLWEIYMAEFGMVLEGLNDGEPFSLSLSITSKLLQRLRIERATIRANSGSYPSAIVTTYLKGRGLIDSHLYNNQLIEKYGEFQRLRQKTGSARYAPQIDAALVNLTSNRMLPQNLSSNELDLKS